MPFIVSFVLGRGITRLRKSKKYSGLLTRIDLVSDFFPDSPSLPSDPKNLTFLVLRVVLSRLPMSRRCSHAWPITMTWRLLPADRPSWPCSCGVATEKRAPLSNDEIEVRRQLRVDVRQKVDRAPNNNFRVVMVGDKRHPEQVMSGDAGMASSRNEQSFRRKETTWRKLDVLTKLRATPTRFNIHSGSISSYNLNGKSLVLLRNSSISVEAEDITKATCS